MDLKEDVKKAVVGAVATKISTLASNYVLSGKIKVSPPSNLKIGTGAVLVAGGIAAGAKSEKGFLNVAGAIARKLGVSTLTSAAIDAGLSKVIK